MRIYLASALSNHELNERIDATLVSLGHTCFLPQREAVDSAAELPELDIVIRNCKGIEQAEWVLAVSKGLGNDTAWELGYARGLNRKCVLLCEFPDLNSAKRSIMPYYNVKCVVAVSSFSLETIQREIDDVMSSIISSITTWPIWDLLGAGDRSPKEPLVIHSSLASATIERENDNEISNAEIV